MRHNGAREPAGAEDTSRTRQVRREGPLGVAQSRNRNRPRARGAAGESVEINGIRINV